MYDQGANRDQRVAQIATSQWGVVSSSQLRLAGIDKHGVLHRVRTGRLHRVHRGVYAVGHLALSREGRWTAAAVACGGGPRGAGPVLDRWSAALSHRSAAELWTLLPPRDGATDVTVPGDGGKKRRKGIRVHRSLTLLPADVTLKEGIPVTRPARTIADLRRVAGRPRDRGGISRRELRRAIRQAEFLGLPLAPGDGDRTRSDLERDFLRVCRRHRLPGPEVNVRVGRDLVDFLWREQRLVVETDGYVPHRGKIAFQDDRERDLRLRGLGFEVVRLSERQINDQPAQVAEVLAHLLAP